jgi:hypothetical protein
MQKPERRSLPRPESEEGPLRRHDSRLWRQPGAEYTAGRVASPGPPPPPPTPTHNVMVPCEALIEHGATTQTMGITSMAHLPCVRMAASSPVQMLSECSVCPAKRALQNPPHPAI